MKTGYILFLAIVALTAVRAEDLTTRDGKVYHDYKVLSHDAGFLTILYSDGGGKIPLSNLPDDLQKKYGYDKAQADAFIQSAIQQDRKDRAALTTERNLTAQKKAAAAEAAASPMDPQTPASGLPASASDVFTEQKPNNVPTPGPAQPGAAQLGAGSAPALPGVQTQPSPMTEEKRQEAMDYARAKINEIKGYIRTDEMQEARQRAGLLLSGQTVNGGEVTNQTPVAASGAERQHRMELAGFRSQLRQLRASAPPVMKPTLTDDQIADMRAKVKKLKWDIRDMQRALEQDSPGIWDPKTFDYPDEIAEEADQMKKLQDQLPPETPNADPDQAAADALKSPLEQTIPSGPLTQQDIDAIKQKIKALKEDIAFMKKEESRGTDPLTGQRISGIPRGGFADKIDEENKQVLDLTDRITPQP